MEVFVMDLNHALHVFRLYYHRLEQDPPEAAGKFLTEAEKQAIADLEKVVLQYADQLARKTSRAVTRAA